MPPTILLLDEGGALHGALRAASGQDELQGQWLVAASVEIAQSLLEQHAVDAVVLPWALRKTLPQSLPSGWQGVPLVLLLPPDGEISQALGPVHGVRDGDTVALLQCLRELGLLQSQHQDAQIPHEAQQTLQRVVDSISQGVVLIDADGRIRVHNHRMQELLDLPSALLEHQPAMDEVLQFQKDRGDFDAAYIGWDATSREYLGSYVSGQPHHTQSPEVYLRRTAQGRYLEARTRMLPGGGLVRTYTDVTDYLAAQEALRQSETRWRSLTHLSSDWFWEQDADLRFVRLEGSARQSLAMSYEDHYGLTRWELPDVVASEAQWSAHRALLYARQPVSRFRGSKRQAPDGTTVWVSVSGEPVFDAAGRFTGYMGVARNITRQKQAEAEIQRLAFYDELTHLPNRRLLIERLEQALAQCGRSASHGALLYLDLDHFKDVNDTLGHEWGDELLRQAGIRLCQCVRTTDTVARLGGDEFVVVLQGLDVQAAEAAMQAEAVAQKILMQLNVPYALTGAELHCPPSIGVALFQDAQLFGAGIAATRRHGHVPGQGPGPQRHELFRPGDAGPGVGARCPGGPMYARDWSAWSSACITSPWSMRQARCRVLKPWCAGCIRSGAWCRRGNFIPLSEQTGLIHSLGRLVLQAACVQLMRWAADPVRCHWTLAVNVSAREFRHPRFRGAGARYPATDRCRRRLAQAGADREPVAAGRGGLHRQDAGPAQTGRGLLHR
jgi:diguanylate cyclase (GGDEF)-like protein/PAS domain S-box-containing protein